MSDSTRPIRLRVPEPSPLHGFDGERDPPGAPLDRGGNPLRRRSAAGSARSALGGEASMKPSELRVWAPKSSKESQRHKSVWHCTSCEKEKNQTSAYGIRGT